MGDKKERGLDDFAIKFIKKHNELNAIISNIFADNPRKLILGIRNNYINIYHKCSNVMKIPIGKRGIKKPEIDSKYKKRLADKYQKSMYHIDKKDINSSFIEKEMIDIIDDYLKNDKNTAEKELQHTIIIKNNKIVNAKWFCVDLEYEIHRNDGKDRFFGRQDIIAVSREKNDKYKIAIIELKVGLGAFKKTGGISDDEIKSFINRGEKLNLDDKSFYDLGSGIVGHFSNFVRYLDDVKYRDNMSRFEILKSDMVNILKSYEQLGYGDEEFKDFARNIAVDQILDYPEIIFLVYSDKNGKNLAEIKEEFKKYVFKDSSEISIEKLWDDDVLNNYNGKNGTREPIKVIFRDSKHQGLLFSDFEISEAKNIFDEEAYK